jgi:glycosyltransferase involved in cell wall biosynthesis
MDVRYLKRRGIGISRYVAHSARELIEAGANVTLLTDDKVHCGQLRDKYPDAMSISLSGRSGFVWEQLVLLRHLRTAEYDAFIAPGNYGLPLFYHGRTRLIVVIHDLIPVLFPRLYMIPRPLWSAKYLLSTGIVGLRANRIVTMSHSSARDIARLLRRRSADVAYPEITVPFGYSDASQRPAVIQGMSDYFVYHGGADPRKNVPMLLRAFALLVDSLPTAQLVMIGSGYESYQGMMEALGIRYRVHLLGYVSEAEKIATLSGATAVVYPSSYEGFGVPVMEGMAAGIPVVSGSDSSLTEVGGSAAIYVRPLNEPNLAAAMIQATTDEAGRHARTAGPFQLAILARRQQSNTLVGVVASELACTAAGNPQLRGLQKV